MNEYKISDISVGMKESFAVTITDKMMKHFYDITSDENPLHVNSQFARERGFDAQFRCGICIQGYYCECCITRYDGDKILIRAS